ncbi:MAG: purine-binding chemotaxis protein CheW [Deltaproteobacteria bacterium]|nr:purine-binding chemotaxis protein CheW [Deltaproteobacteria bacterium]
MDWDAVRRTVEEAGERLAKGRRLDREEAEALLLKRAEAFSAVAGEAIEEGFIEVVEFRLAAERYAFESSMVREVVPISELTPMPCTPPFVLGIINLRGQILSVIDIKKLFGLPEKGITQLNKVIVLSSDEMEFGVLADEVSGSGRVRPDALKRLPTLTGIREEFLKGVTGEGLVVLDAGRLLADKSIVVHEAVE